MSSFYGNAGGNTSEIQAAVTAASGSASKAEGYAIGTQNGTDYEQSPYHNNNAKYYYQQASNAAGTASDSATNAGINALKSEGYAVGKQNGTAVESGSPYYQNNAEYFAEQAAASASTFETDTTLSVSGKAADAKKTGDEISDIESALEIKANIDGYYESMTVGNAEQLVATVGVEDKVPYNFRTSGGSADIGDREVDKIVGGTVAWNQLVKDDYSNLVGSNITSTVLDGEITIVCNTDVNNVKGIVYNNLKNGHVYCGGGNFKTDGTAEGGIGFRAASGAAINSGTSDTMGWTNTSSYISMWRIAKPSDDTSRFGAFLKNNTPNGNYGYFNAVMLIDLTQMFGSAIADYINTLETANVGAGVAWFRKLFPKDYYAYDAGSLQSVQVASHDMVGFNAWDEQWEIGRYDTSTGDVINSYNSIRSKSTNYIPVIPNTTYYGKCTTGYVVFFYDASKNYIGYVEKQANTTFITPANACFMHFRMSTNYGTTYNHDICINLSWDGERDGEYEPYVKHSYPLDDSLTLRGIPKLDASNNLYYDGDTYEANGTVTRRYRVVDLGNATWTGNFSSHEGQFYTSLSDYKSVSNTNSRNGATCISNKYISGNAYDALIDKRICAYASYIWIYDTSFSSASDLKTSLSGCYIIYELDTPTTELAEPYQNPQIVDDFGTEEYVDAGVTASTPIRDVAIPVGHETTYQANLRAKLEMAPESPSDGDGDYIVRQTNGQNEYTKLVIPTELPANPSEAGTYSLKVTVPSSGTPTLAWVADT